MGMYTSAFSRGDNRFIAIPVFPSRFFRHSAIYVRKESKARKPEDLAGTRIGVVQWSQTAGIYVRGFLADTIGIDLSSIEWVQGGVNDPGRQEPATLRLPGNIRLRSVTDRNLNDMLIAGDIDAIITARPPRGFIDGSWNVKHLIEAYPQAEADYFRATGIFPIMHTIAIRRDVYDANRWIARNLMLAFEEAKERSVARMLDFTAAHVPLPWVNDLAQRVLRSKPDGGLWPYGIKHNRTTLYAFLRWGYEQGVFHRKLAPADIFAPEALAEIPV